MPPHPSAFFSSNSDFSDFYKVDSIFQHVKFSLWFHHRSEDTVRYAPQPAQAMLHSAQIWLHSMLTSVYALPVGQLMQGLWLLNIFIIN